MASNDPKNFRPPGDRWEAIKRAQRRMSAPSGGEDVGALLAKSLDAYWSQRESEVGAETSQELARHFRRAALLLPGAVGRGFWSDFLLASLPVGMVLLVGARFGLSLPVWWPKFASALTIVSILVVVFIFKRHRVVWFEYSGGALVAGLLISMLIGLQNFRQVQIDKGLVHSATQEKLEDTSFLSMISRNSAGDFLSPHLAEDAFSLTTTVFSKDEVVYKASADDLPGEFVAELKPNYGEVHWAASKSGQVPGRVRIAFAVGKLVESNSDGSSWLLYAGDRKLQLNANKEALGIQPKLGDCLLVAYRPAPVTSMTSTVTRATRLDTCSDKVDETVPDLGQAVASPP
jgi:hypothetical protein